MEATYQVGEQFQLQFIWKLPSEQYIRAIFQGKVVELQPQEDRYLVQLTQFLAGGQEDVDGTPLPQSSYDKQWWANVIALQKRYIQVAYEAADGRPLYMRLPTLTSEHTFFFRYDAEGNRLPEEKEDTEKIDVIGD